MMVILMEKETLARFLKSCPPREVQRIKNQEALEARRRGDNAVRRVQFLATDVWSRTSWTYSTSTWSYVHDHPPVRGLEL